MSSVNKVILIGNLGADPELKYTPGANPRAVCNLSVATNEVWKDKGGQKQERVEWHRVNVWGDLAENCSKFLAKGRTVYIEGKIQTRSWEDKEGKKRYTTEIVADKVVFLGGGDRSDRQQGGHSGGNNNGWGGGAGPDAPPVDDDVPF